MGSWEHSFKHYKRLLGETVESASLEVLRTSLEKTPSNLSEFQSRPCSQWQVGLEDLQKFLPL